MASTFPAAPPKFVGRLDLIGRFKARLEHFNFYIYEGIAGVGKTTLARKLAHETRSVGLKSFIHMSIWPGEAISSVLARVECAFGRVATGEVQGDPYHRLRELLISKKTVLVLDDLQHMRREDALALVRASRSRSGQYRIIATSRGEVELSAIDRMEIHVDRVGQLLADDVKRFAEQHGVKGEALSVLVQDAARGGASAHPMTLRFLLAVGASHLPDKDFLALHPARSLNSFKAVFAEGAKHLDADLMEALTLLARVGLPVDKAVAGKIAGVAAVQKLIKRGFVDLIDDEIHVHELLAQALAGELELSSTAARTVAKHFEREGLRRSEPPLVLRAAEILARAGDAQEAVESLAAGWESVRDLGFLEAYLKALASTPATGQWEKRLRLLSARARMRQTAPSAVREEMERLAEERDTWTRSRALAALTQIYDYMNEPALVVSTYEALRKTNAGDDLLGPAAVLAAEALLRVGKLTESEKLAKTLLAGGGKAKDAARDGELRRLLARVYAQTGRVQEAIVSAQAAAKAFDVARDMYHAATAWGHIGDLYREAGDFEQARAAFQRFHQAAAQAGDRNLMQIAELAEAWISLDIGDLGAAAKHLAAVDKELTSVPSRRLRRYLGTARALLESGRGFHEQAAQHLPRVAEMWEEAGQHAVADRIHCAHVRSLIALGRLDEAEKIVHAALKRLDVKAAAPRVAAFLRESALVRLRKKDTRRAMAELAEARKLFAEGGNRREEALTLYRIAHAVFEDGDLALAEKSASEAQQVARSIKHTRAIALSTELLGRIALAKGNAKAAVAATKDAVAALRKLGDELGALHATESLVRSLLVAGDLAGVIRMGPRLSEHAEKLEIREVRVRAIVLTGVALVRKGRMDAALRCFRELREGTPATLALMWRFGEALASMQGDRATATQRRQRWVEQTRLMPENQQQHFLASLEQLQLAPRERCYLRTAKGEQLLGTEQIAWLDPAPYEVFLNAAHQTVHIGGTLVPVPTHEQGLLLRELVAAMPKPLPMGEAFSALFQGEPDAKADRKVAPVVKELQKTLKNAKGLKIAATNKELKLTMSGRWGVLVPTTLVSGTLTPLQQKVVRLMRRLGTVPVQAVQDALTLPKPVVKRELAQLVKDGLVEAVRAGRGQAFRLA